MENGSSGLWKKACKSQQLPDIGLGWVQLLSSGTKMTKVSWAWQSLQIAGWWEWLMLCAGMVRQNVPLDVALGR